jgi:hypothetical protein
VNLREMRNWVVLAAIIFFFGAPSRAEEAKAQETDLKPGGTWLVRAGVTPVSGFTSGATQVSLSLGCRANYFFTPALGLSAGWDFTYRGVHAFNRATGSTFTPNVSFFDFPVGFAFRSHWGGNNQGPVSILALGGFLSVPLRDVVVNGSTIQTSKLGAGIHLEGSTTFPLNDTVSLGIPSTRRHHSQVIPRKLSKSV